VSVGDAWKMGVYHPAVSNRSCRFPAQRTMTFDSEHAPGVSSILVNVMPQGPSNTHKYKPMHIYAVGDTLSLGPSSHSDNSGATEQVIITSISGYTIGVSPSTTYRYSDDDSIMGVGSVFVGEWGHGDSNAADLSGNLTNSIGVGVDDDYALYITKTASTGNLYIYTVWQTGEARQPYYEYNTYYFWSFYAKASALSGTIQMNNSNLNASAIKTISQTANFTEYADVKLSSTTTIKSPNIYLYMTSASTCTDLAIDHFTCCHAKGSTDSASGIYTFAELADLGSIRWKRLDKSLYTKFGRNSLIGNRSSGDNPKYSVSARFTNVSQAFVDELRNFMNWQDAGNLLCLKTSLNTLPPYLVGRMSIGSTTKKLWDLSTGSFNLIFEEV